jgi:CheY-like chemotaxis protein
VLFINGRFFAQGHVMQRTARVSTSSFPAPAAVVDRSTDTTVKVLHVLIADANARTLATRVEQLNAAGLRVSIARTSFEAIVKATCNVPDVILLDGSLDTASEGINTAETLQMLTICPMTSHIPIYRLTPGRRVPQRILSVTRRFPS